MKDLIKRAKQHFEKASLLRQLSIYRDEQRVDQSGKITETYEPQKRPASAKIIDRLNAAGVNGVPSLTPLAGFQTRFYDRCKTDKTFRSALAKAGLDLKMPGGKVHVISRGTNLLIDINGADFLLEALDDEGLAPQSRQRILDFGGSSGRTIRTMAYGHPEVNWMCCDPSPPSIEWGNANLSDISFFLSHQEPPLALDDNSLDGFFAKSIWTHFSEDASKAWLLEMGRVVKKGGFALITAHGPHDLARRITWGNPAPRYDRLAGFDGYGQIEALKTITRGVVKDGFFFRPYGSLHWQADIREAEDADTAHWGLTFVTRKWFSDHISDTPWRLRRHFIGRTGFRHDLYLLEKT